jgi:hypothetical protein
MQSTEPGGRRNARTRLAAMPGQKRVAGALAVAAAAVAISACGSSSSSDQTIPSAKSQILQSRLSAVELAVSEGHCNVAETRAQSFVDAVNQLPDTVGTENKDALRTAGENLQTLAQQPSQCKPTPIGTSGTQGDQATSTSSTTEIVPTTPTTTATTTSTTSTSPPGNSGNSQGGGPPTGTPSGQGDTGGGNTGGGDTGGGSAGGGGDTGSGGTGGTGVGGGGTG